MESDDVLVTARDLLEDGDLVADHVLPIFHKFLVNDLARIVLSRLDMYCLLYDRVRPTA
jgi:hypothetical protein